MGPKDFRTNTQSLCDISHFGHLCSEIVHRASVNLYLKSCFAARFMSVTGGWFV